MSKPLGKEILDTSTDCCLGYIVIFIVGGLCLSLGDGDIGGIVAFLIFAVVAGVLCWYSGNEENHKTPENIKGKWKRCPKCKNNIPTALEKCYYCGYRF